MSSAGLEHGGQGDRHGCGSSLVTERQEWSCLVRYSPGLPSYAVAGAAVGASCARVPPVSYGGFWKNFLFYVASLPSCSHLENWTLLLCPLIFQSFSWRLGVACGVQRIGSFGRSFVHLTWFDSGHMFFEGFGRIYIFSTLR